MARRALFLANGSASLASLWFSARAAEEAHPLAPHAKDPAPADVDLDGLIECGLLVGLDDPSRTLKLALIVSVASAVLGTWTAEEFIAALRAGRHQGRERQILPPMPWPMVSPLDDEDLRAVVAYLPSIPAISNRVSEPLLPEATHDAQVLLSSRTWIRDHGSGT